MQFLNKLSKCEEKKIHLIHIHRLRNRFLAHLYPVMNQNGKKKTMRYP